MKNLVKIGLFGLFLSLGGAASAQQVVLPCFKLPAPSTSCVQISAANPLPTTASSVASQTVGGTYNTTPPTLTTGQNGNLQLDNSGNLATFWKLPSSNIPVSSNVAGGDAFVNSFNAYDMSSFNYAFNGTTWDRVRTGGTTGSLSVSGGVASGSADSGNPVKIGGVFSTTLPTLTNGQRGNVQLDSGGRQLVAAGSIQPVAVSVSATTTPSVASAAPVVMDFISVGNVPVSTTNQVNVYDNASACSGTVRWGTIITTATEVNVTFPSPIAFSNGITICTSASTASVVVGTR